MNTDMLREITKEEIASYHRDGAVMLKGVLAPEWVDMVREGLEEVRNHPSDSIVTLTNRSGEGCFLYEQWVSTRSEKLKQFVMKSPAAKCAGILHGGQGLKLYKDMMFYKDAGSFVPTLWHQDTAYKNLIGKDLVRVWICCDATPRDIALEFLRGSHLWNVVYRNVNPKDDGLNEKPAFEENLPTVPPINAHRDSFDIIGWETEPGDILVFYGNTLHGTQEVTRTIQKRRALVMFLTGDDVYYLRRPNSKTPELASMMGLDLQSGDDTSNR